MIYFNTKFKNNIGNLQLCIPKEGSFHKSQNQAHFDGKSQKSELEKEKSGKDHDLLTGFLEKLSIKRISQVI